MTSYHDTWHKAHYDRLVYKARKENRYPERITIAANIYNISPTQYALKAIETQLQFDGITVESLLDRAEPVKQD